MKRPFVVGLGGTPRARSSTELALRCALKGAEAAGARTQLVAGNELLLPLFDPNSAERDAGVKRLLSLLQESDGVIVASPGYHGGLSGLVKNALDYIEAPYLDGRAGGCIASAGGWQAANSTLTALRGVMHALRAWPTPLGVSVNSMVVKFDGDGTCSDEIIRTQLELVGRQVAEFAMMRRHFNGKAEGTITSTAVSTTQ